MCCADIGDNIAKYLSLFLKMLRDVKKKILSQNSPEQSVLTSTVVDQSVCQGMLEDRGFFSFQLIAKTDKSCFV